MPDRPRTKYLAVGVTGAIGSGKTTVCRLFAALGRHVISADELARDVVNTNRSVRKRIRDTFGKAIYGGGELDRPALASRVFTHPEELKKLNRIVHPAVISLIERKIRAIPAENRSPYVLVEAALIFEAGYDSTLDYTIVVDSREEIRIQRITSRDGLSEPDIRRRMRSQMPPSEKRTRADFVIVNEGSEADLIPGVRLLDAILAAMAGTVQ